MVTKICFPEQKAIEKHLELNAARIFTGEAQLNESQLNGDLKTQIIFKASNLFANRALDELRTPLCVIGLINHDPEIRLRGDQIDPICKNLYNILKECANSKSNDASSSTGDHGHTPNSGCSNNFIYGNNISIGTQYTYNNKTSSNTYTQYSSTQYSSTQYSSTQYSSTQNDKRKNSSDATPVKSASPSKGYCFPQQATIQNHLELNAAAAFEGGGTLNDDYKKNMIMFASNFFANKDLSVAETGVGIFQIMLKSNPKLKQDHMVTIKDTFFPVLIGCAKAQREETPVLTQNTRFPEQKTIQNYLETHKKVAFTGGDQLPDDLKTKIILNLSIFFADKDLSEEATGVGIFNVMMNLNTGLNKEQMLAIYHTLSPVLKECANRQLKGNDVTNSSSQPAVDSSKSSSSSNAHGSNISNNTNTASFEPQVESLSSSSEEGVGSLSYSSEEEVGSLSYSSSEEEASTSDSVGNTPLQVFKKSQMTNDAYASVTVDVGWEITLGVCFEPSWDKNPIAFTAISANQWSGSVPLYKEYKFVKLDKEGQVIAWEDHANRFCKETSTSLSAGEVKFS